MSLPPNIPPVNIDRAETAITRWLIHALPGTKADHVMDPDYWVHLAGRLRRTPNKGLGDEIRVLADDGSFDIEVTVVAIDPLGYWAQVRPVRVWERKVAEDVPAAQWPDKDGYRIDLSGPQKWRIIDAQNNIVAKGYPDETAAVEALANLKAAKVAKAA